MEAVPALKPSEPSTELPCLAATSCRELVLVHNSSIMPETAQLVATHRPDREVYDVVGRPKWLYSTKPTNQDQRKINGIRYGSTDHSTGRFCVRLDVCAGQDVCVEEQMVDPKDLEHWQGLLAYDQLRRTARCDTTDRNQRYRTNLVKLTDSSLHQVRAPVYARRGPTSHSDHTLMSRAQLLSPSDVTVLSVLGQAETLVTDGQVEVEVLFHWTGVDKHGARVANESFEIQTVMLGYEPSCRCGVDCSKHTCVHLHAFYRWKIGFLEEEHLMWQVAFITSELQTVADALRISNALQVDAQAHAKLQSLQEGEHQRVLEAAKRRSAITTRDEAFGTQLKAIKHSITQATSIGIPSKPKLTAHNNGQTTVTMPHCDVLVESSPTKLAPQTASASATPTTSKNSKSSRARKQSTGGGLVRTQSTVKRPKIKASATKRIARGGVDVKRLPLGQPRIYRNWSKRRCYGQGCERMIEQGEWFVNIPLRNMVKSTGLIVPQNFGWCLETQGACLDNPVTHVRQLMRDQDVTIPNALPVVVVGRQECDNSELELLCQKLPNRAAPYLREV
jgi:hypothetical protein